MPCVVSNFTVLVIEKHHTNNWKKNDLGARLKIKVLTHYAWFGLLAFGEDTSRVRGRHMCRHNYITLRVDVGRKSRQAACLIDMLMGPYIAKCEF